MQINKEQGSIEEMPVTEVTIIDLDRLGRSMAPLVTLIEDIGRKGIGFRSLCDGDIDTTASGELIFNIFSSLSQFERRLIQERTKAVLDAARASKRSLYAVQ